MALSQSRNVASKFLSTVVQLAKHRHQVVWSRNLSSEKYAYQTLLVSEPHKHVFHVEINRPDQRNAMNKDFWREYFLCFKEIHKDKECRAVVVSGSGKMFTSGLDFMDMAELAPLVTGEEDIARKAKYIQEMIDSYQESFSAMEKCSKPVITAVHSACIGAGLDLICSADIRYCSEDSWFQAKEVDIGMAADVGTLQRFPRIVGNDSLVREVIYTGRKIPSSEAKQMGLVSQIFPSKEETIQGAIELAKVIASRSPVAVQGSKVNLIYSRDHSVPDGLKFMTYYNMSMLQSEDLLKASMAVITRSKEAPDFTDL